MSRFTSVVVAAILSTATISLTVTTAHAAPPAVYVVKEGDSLSRIAQKLGVKLPDLLNANGMTVSSLILPGQQLVVPQSDSSGSSGATYTVKAGDSLSAIATRSKVSLSALLAANGMTVSSLITPGMSLSLPAGAVTPAAAQSTSTTTNASGSTSSGATYTVKSGDSLSVIASRSKDSLSALLAANNMTVNSLILPGTKLNLPAGAAAPSTPSSTSGATGGSGATYTVKAGDSLGGIATRNGVSLSALLAANNMTAKSLILPGMQLALPAGATPAQTESDGQQPSDARIQTVLQFALAQQGKPYLFNTSGPDTYDCSGLTKRAYAQVGISLVHQSASQATQGTAVAFWSEPIRPGDLVFMAPKSDVITHVGIAIDSDTWIQARRPGETVRVGPMPSKSSIVAVRRFIP